MYVDDNLYIDITHPDGSVVSYTHFLANPFAPVDLTAYFASGTNTVEVTFENLGGMGQASAYWLVNVSDEAMTLPFQITDAITPLNLDESLQ
jgi:hypothetical protein